MPATYISDVSIEQRDHSTSFTVNITRWLPAITEDDDNSFPVHTYSKVSPASMGRLFACIGQFIKWGNTIMFEDYALSLSLPLP